MLYNWISFVCYAAFSCALFFSSDIRQTYRDRHDGHDPGVRYAFSLERCSCHDVLSAARQDWRGMSRCWLVDMPNLSDSLATSHNCPLTARAILPHRLNDVGFAVHATLAGAALLAQIALYGKGSQTLSATCKRVSAALVVGLAVAIAVSLWPAVPWEPLDFFYLLGYIKARRTLERWVPGC